MSTIGISLIVFWLVAVPATGLLYELIKDISKFCEKRKYAHEYREIKRMETEIALIKARSEERREELEIYEKKGA